MKTIVIGDIHGKVELVEAALARKEPKVFVGDFLDSFERTSVEEVTCLRLVYEAIQRRENVQACIGNHELSYLYKSQLCSGYDARTQILVDAFQRDVAGLETWMKPFVWVEDVLVTHAGLSAERLPPSDTQDVLILVKEYLDRPITSFFDIGYARGGGHRTGDIFWCDIREFAPIPNVKQIFGHSRGGPHEFETDGELTSLGIDCLDDIHLVAYVENGNIGIETL